MLPLLRERNRSLTTFRRAVSINTDYIISELNSHHYCLRKLNKFNVNICILRLFYQLVIKSDLHIVVFVGV